MAGRRAVEEANRWSRPWANAVVKTPPILALQAGWMVTILLVLPPFAHIEARADPGEDAVVIDFAEACVRAKSTGVRGRLLDEERTMFSGGSGANAARQATALTAVILDRRRLAAATDEIRAAAEAHCRARSLACQLPVAERIEQLFAEVRRQVEAVEVAGGVAALPRTELEQRSSESSQRRLDVEARLDVECLALASLVGVQNPSSLVVAGGPDVPAVIDQEQYVATAISRDPELMTIEVVRSRLRRETLPVTRRFLSLSDPAVGLPPPPGVVSRHGLRQTVSDTAPMEIRLRTRQLEELARQRREAVRLDVTVCVQSLRTARESRDLARAAVNRAVQYREQLTRSADGPGVTATSLSLAEIDEFAARLQLLEAELRIELAYVRLLASGHGF